jgi:hypothetical protein
LESPGPDSQQLSGGPDFGVGYERTFSGNYHIKDNLGKAKGEEQENDVTIWKEGYTKAA